MATLEGLAYCAACVQEKVKTQGIGSFMDYDPNVGNRNLPLARFAQQDLRGFGYFGPGGEVSSSTGDYVSAGSGTPSTSSGSSGGGIWDTIGGAANKIFGGAVDAGTDALKREIDPDAYKKKQIIIGQGQVPWGMIMLAGGVFLGVMLIMRKRSAT